MSDLDPRAALAHHAAAGGVSLAALSAMIGRNAAYLQQYVKRGTPRALADRDRQALAAFFGVAEAVLGGPAAMGGPVRVPRLDIGVSAGPGALVDGEVTLGANAFDPVLLRRLGLTPGAGAILRVRGSSMEPGLMDGDQILIDTADRRPRGGIFVIRIDDATMVKRLAVQGGRIVATSDNPAAPPVPDGAIAVIGRVVWQMRETR
ncbi:MULTISPECIES: S24 family peptidase [unclassified Sphingomonas]|uniref:S24 family peptidase n=1 Tax=unclassified Sphingomonas TaxID=196159 RepID=UPI002269DAC5|nr:MULTISPECIES: S24 family peptidase [unclassified Sphingomonas]